MALYTGYTNTIKAMILDLANLKDFNSNSMKNNAYDIIKDILVYAAASEDESEDSKLAKEFSDELKLSISAIANDILITADNKEDQVTVQNFEEEDTEKDKESEEDSEYEEVESNEDEDEE